MGPICQAPLIPSLSDQILWAQSRRPMDQTRATPARPKRVTPSETWYKVQIGREAFRKVLAEAKPERFEVIVDGRVLPTDLLLAEAMNISHVGPGLPLARSADPGDGLLDVVYLQADRCAEMFTWLCAPHSSALPPVAVHRGGEDQDYDERHGNSCGR